MPELMQNKPVRPEEVTERYVELEEQVNSLEELSSHIKDHLNEGEVVTSIVYSVCVYIGTPMDPAEYKIKLEQYEKDMFRWGMEKNQRERQKLEGQIKLLQSQQQSALLALQNRLNSIPRE